MTESPDMNDEQQTPGAGVSGGGPTAAEAIANDPIRNAAAKLELLSDETRETVLARMDPEIAERIRRHLASQPDNRPHGQFSTDVATRRRLIHETADRVASSRTAQVDRMVEQLDGAPAMAPPPGMPAGMQQPVAPSDPLDQLRDLHPAAIARAMQGERAEAWAIVLDHLDATARDALLLYLDSSARVAIEDARARQAELAASSPALISTVVAAIARTVVPRAMREHHQLLSTTPLAWTGMPA